MERRGALMVRRLISNMFADLRPVLCRRDEWKEEVRATTDSSDCSSICLSAAGTTPPCCRRCTLSASSQVSVTCRSGSLRAPLGCGCLSETAGPGSSQKSQSLELKQPRRKSVRIKLFMCPTRHGRFLKAVSLQTEATAVI